ncbi:MAG: hypothetical protein K8R59_02895 [Thermoanaerobaculales bacterium]|nr:hypothetical protein [Thermoanaerobaculales bacterium]
MVDNPFIPGDDDESDFGRETTGDEIDEEIQRLAGRLERTSTPAPSTLTTTAKQRNSWRDSWALTGVLAAVAIILTAANLSGIGPFSRTTEVTPEEARIRARQTLVFGVEEIEDYRAQHGAPPTNLEMIGLSPKGDFEYEFLGEGEYRLTAQVSGERESYESTSDSLAMFDDLPSRGKD